MLKSKNVVTKITLVSLTVRKETQNLSMKYKRKQKSKVMKNSYVLMLLVCLLTFSLGANATNLSTDEFQITPLEKPFFESTATKAWSLKYNAKEDMQLTIEKVQTKKGFEYLVYSEFFEVSYACCEKGFGAKRVKAAWSKIDLGLTNMVLDDNQLLGQKVISSTQVNEESALVLIASYLPELLKDQYKHLLI